MRPIFVLVFGGACYFFAGSCGGLNNCNGHDWVNDTLALVCTGLFAWIVCQSEKGSLS